MRKNIFIALASFACLALAGTFSSCKKSFYGTMNYSTDDSSKVYLKVIDAAPNFRAVTGGADTFNIYVNGVKVNGSTLSYGSMFPSSVSSTSSAINDSYMSLTPGTKTIKLLGTDSSTIATFTKTLTAGKYYTLFLTDSLLSSRDSSKIFVQDNLNSITPTSGYFGFRFINAMLTDSSTTTTKTTTVDVFSYARNTTLISKIKPDSVTSFILAGYNAAVADTFYITRTPTTSTASLANRVILAKAVVSPMTTTVVGIAEERMYTFFLYGTAYYTKTAKAPTLTYYINK